MLWYQGLQAGCLQAKGRNAFGVGEGTRRGRGVRTGNPGWKGEKVEVQGRCVGNAGGRIPYHDSPVQEAPDRCRGRVSVVIRIPLQK